MNVNFKLIEGGKVPVKGTSDAACFDLFARERKFYPEYIEYKLGVAFEIPKGYCGLVFPRSSITSKDLILKNSVGVIDSDFRGEISARFFTVNEHIATNFYNIGDRVAQILFIPVIEAELIECSELSTTERGTNGYGSTGK